MTEMILFLFPPRFPTFFWRYTYPSTVAYPFIPICPVINNLLPLKAWWIEEERSKKPCPHHEPYWYSDQDIWNCTSIWLAKYLVHNKQNHQFNALNKMAARIEPIVLSKLSMDHHKTSTCSPVLCTPMKQCSSIIVGLCSQRKCEEDRSQL